MKNTNHNSFYVNVIMAGFGGQGLMFIGKLLAFSGMRAGKNVTWIPSYGPEMRGGTANCTVVISDKKIGSPVITYPQSLIIMNNPSLKVFEPRLQTKGTLFLNNSLITHQTKRTDIDIISIPANELAMEAGEKRTANMVMLGAYIVKTKVLSKEEIINGLIEFFKTKKEFLEVNTKAFESGMDYIKND